jgi:predicted Fe-S protein YdhL (DUF1289 family)
VLHAFIDESGDDGFSPKSTHWLVIAALVLHKARSAAAMENWKQCKIDAHRRPHERLHWNKLDHPAKKAVLRRVLESDFDIVAVAAHKPSFAPDEVLRLKCPTLYCFLTKYLVERLSWLARDHNCKVNITFENRPQMNFAELREYIFTTLKLPAKNTQISHDYLGGFNCKHFSQETRLEIADTMAGAIGNGLNEDAFGGIETSYALSLLPKMWVRNGNLYSYGFKICPMIDRTKFQFFADIDKVVKKAPG